MPLPFETQFPLKFKIKQKNAQECVQTRLLKNSYFLFIIIQKRVLNGLFFLIVFVISLLLNPTDAPVNPCH